MDEEEKKAIDNMKSLLLYSIEHEYFSPFQEQEIDDMNIVLNLIEKQSKKIEELQAINQMQKYRIEVMDERELISRDEVEEIIKTRIKEIQNMYDKLSKNPKEHLHSKTEYLIVICELQSILNEIKGDDKI